MTPYPNPPLQRRKDIDALISQQTSAPCAVDGYGAESVLAFLLQLYAYVVSNFRDDLAPLPDSQETPHGGTYELKQYLMTSGRYQVVVYYTDFRARPNALRLRQRPTIYNGTSIGSWIILFPGAERDTYFKLGRVVSAMDMDMPKRATFVGKAEVVSVISVMVAVVTIGGYRYAPSTLNIHRPIRLIPP